MTVESVVSWAATWTAPLGHVLLDFLWQGAAIGVGAWLLLVALRDARPQTRYAVACLALSACLFAPLSALWRPGAVSVDTEAAAAIAVSVSTADPAPSAAIVRLWSIITPDRSASIESALPWIVGFWSFGVILMLMRLIAGALWVQRLRARAAVAIDEDLQQRFDALCQRMGIQRTVHLRAIAGDRLASISPIAAGVLAPIVMLPAALLARMPTDLLEALIAHELAHIRRHDYLINLLQTLIEALLFYHPVVWWLSRRIRQERELVADDLAARALGAPRTLALALAELDRLHAQSAAAALPAARFALTLSQAAHGGPLMSRIHSLIQPKRPALGIGFALPFIGLAAIGLACLAYAQSDRPQPIRSLVAKASSTARATMPDVLPAPTLSTQQAETGVVGLVVNGNLDINSDDGHDRVGYALIRNGEEGFSISGHIDDIDRIREAKARIDGDFMWFRRDGKAYVVRDPATLARVHATWRASETNEAKMRTLNAEMQAKSEAVQALAERVSAQATELAMQEANIHARIPDVRSVIDQERLTERLTDVAQQQAELEARYEEDPSRNESEYAHESAALEAQQAALELRMQAIEAEMEAKGAQIEAEMEAKMTGMENELEARLHAATQPLEALGAQMEALGEKQERIMADVDREIMREIDRAMRENLAEPAPNENVRR